MKTTNRHEQDQRRRLGALEDNELEESEHALRQLLTPLSSRTAAPELNARLRQTLRTTHAQLHTEARRGMLGRWLTRKILVPYPLATAACALILALGSWVAVLEWGPQTTLPQSGAIAAVAPPQNNTPNTTAAAIPLAAAAALPITITTNTTQTTQPTQQK